MHLCRMALLYSIRNPISINRGKGHRHPISIKRGKVAGTNQPVSCFKTRDPPLLSRHPETPHATNMKSLTIVLLMFSLQAVMSFNWKKDDEEIRKCTPPKQLEGKYKLNFKSPETAISGTGSIHVDYTIGK